MAVQSELCLPEFEYSITSLFRDLRWIRDQTFEKDAIMNTFKDAGIWPIFCGQALSKMVQYAPAESPEGVKE